MAVCFSLSAGDTALTFDIDDARFYFTQNLTEWEKRSVAWDLFQYGQEVLEKVSQPSYSFTVDSADFLVMDEFDAFKNALSLGKRVYLKLDDGRVLTPLLLGFSHTFDEKSGLTLEFSNKFTSSNENDRLVDLLEQSVSMGKKLDLSREIYAAFVDSHANTAIHDFMNGALDVAKNMVMSSVNQAITWDENGLRLRKWADDSKTSYDPHQVWMMNENIVFTNDGWQTAKMAIGHIVDDKLGDLWGVVADNLVGKMIAGENMYIYSTKPDGTNMSFTVDGTGMRSWNANQIWDSDKGSVAVAPDYGIIAGTKGNPTDSLFKLVDGAIVPVGTEEGKLVLKDGMPSDDRINVWIGTDGTAYFKGTIYGIDGIFKGKLEAATIKSAKIEAATITGTIDSSNGGKIVGTEICVPDESAPKFHVDSDGNTTITGGTLVSPIIKANEFEVFPNDKSSRTGGYKIYGQYNSQPYEMFDIRYFAGDGAYVSLRSPAGAILRFGYNDLNRFHNTSQFYGQVDFSNANVTGIHYTLA